MIIFLLLLKFIFNFFRDRKSAFLNEYLVIFGIFRFLNAMLGPLIFIFKNLIQRVKFYPCISFSFLYVNEKRVYLSLSYQTVVDRLIGYTVVLVSALRCSGCGIISLPSLFILL
uniref:Uncharacterized protein n=1 Tax=Ganoderma calidophilum TaxID=2026244 RepID=A0A2S1WBM0_9APHY|nr:hypothetical protein [Ganoderma calidophilum]AWJ63986.1 hypothetical protein [Ganoderma calidophilum]